jgi:hypothetical protein
MADRVRHGRAGSLHAVTPVNASPEHPILIDKFLEDATEIDVDALADASGGGPDRRESWNTSNRPAFTPATVRAWCRRFS